MNRILSTIVIRIGLVIFLLINYLGESQTLNAQASSFGTTTTKQNNLEEILTPKAQVEKIAGGFEFTEGPVWHPEGFLLFSDIPANIIYQWQPGQKTSVFRQPSGNANGNTLDLVGNLITAVICATA